MSVSSDCVNVPWVYSSSIISETQQQQQTLIFLESIRRSWFKSLLSSILQIVAKVSYFPLFDDRWWFTQSYSCNANKRPIYDVSVKSRTSQKNELGVWRRRRLDKAKTGLKSATRRSQCRAILHRHTKVARLAWRLLTK